MAQYRVDSDIFELPRGSILITMPKYELETGDLALFSVAGCRLPGRWYRDNDGTIYILIPGYRIKLTGKLNVTILGLVVLLNSTPCLN